MSSTVDQLLLNNSDENKKDVFFSGLLQSLLVGTRASNSIPAGNRGEKTENPSGSKTSSEFEFHATFPEFSSLSKTCGKELIELIQLFLEHIYPDHRINILDFDDPIDSGIFECLTDVTGELLDRVDSILDFKNKNRQSNLKGRAQQTLTTSSTHKFQNYSTFNPINLNKPQLQFTTKVDNNRRTPFVPIIHYKPFSIVPLELISRPITELDEQMTKDMGYCSDDAIRPKEYYLHPYQTEINQFGYLTSQLMLPETSQIISPPELSMANLETLVSFVSTQSEFESMFTKIKMDLDLNSNLLNNNANDNTPKEIAFDLEHHSFRTFQGITCLMQLSTRKSHFVIDTISLRDQMFRFLPILANPSIIKVFHGSDQDILWLQRDFGLYVVNMFDTGQAARELNYSRFSLSHLLELHRGLLIDKKHQLSDWRIRPLPRDMLLYAATDTYYLLHLYDKLRSELYLQTGNSTLIENVLSKGRKLCLSRYEKEYFYPMAFLTLIQKNHKILSPIQTSVAKLLWDWRDRVAREEDEGIGYVMSAQLLLRIAASLPKTYQELQKCGNPIPTLVRERAQEIFAIIEKAEKNYNAQQEQAIETSETKFTKNNISTRQSILFNASISQTNVSLEEISMKYNNTTKEPMKSTDWIQSIFEEIYLSPENQNLTISPGNQRINLDSLKNEQELESRKKALEIHEKISREPLFSLSQAQLSGFVKTKKPIKKNENEKKLSSFDNSNENNGIEFTENKIIQILPQALSEQYSKKVIYQNSKNEQKEEQDGDDNNTPNEEIIDQGAMKRNVNSTRYNIFDSIKMDENEINENGTNEIKENKQIFNELIQIGWNENESTNKNNINKNKKQKMTHKNKNIKKNNENGDGNDDDNIMEAAQAISALNTTTQKRKEKRKRETKQQIEAKTGWRSQSTIFSQVRPMKSFTYGKSSNNKRGKK